MGFRSFLNTFSQACLSLIPLELDPIFYIKYNIKLKIQLIHTICSLLATIATCHQSKPQAARNKVDSSRNNDSIQASRSIPDA